MIVRCGRCGTQFDAPGEGRFACPACGTANEVVRREDPGGIVIPPNHPEIEEPPSPRVACPHCGFGFIVGEVETALCPMCGSEVPVGSGNPAEPQSEES